MNSKKILLSVLMLAVVILSPLATACEPIAPLRIENQTDQTLSIFVRFGTADKYYHLGDVAPGEDIKNKNPGILTSNVYYLEAKNSQGEIIYSKKYNDLELDKLDWKVVIPPLGNK
jgi:hypothetical protein